MLNCYNNQYNSDITAKMWCICFKSRDRFTNYVDEWDNEIEAIIINIRKAKRLGKICMNNRLYGRNNLKLEKEILELIKKIDSDIVNTKRKAIQFLTDSTTLYTQRNQQLEFYQNYVKKQIHILKMRKEILHLKENFKLLSEENELLKQQNSMLIEDLKHILQNKPNNSSDCKEIEYMLKMYGQSVTQNPEFLQAQTLAKRQFRNILSKYDTMIYKLEDQIATYQKEQSQIKRAHERFQEVDDEEEKKTANVSEHAEQPVPLDEQEVFNEMTFWLEQEVENRKLLQIQANLGDIYGDFEEDFKKTNSANRMKFSLPKVHRMLRRSQNDNFEQPILDDRNEEKQPLTAEKRHSEPAVAGTSTSVSKIEREELELKRVTQSVTEVRNC